MDFYSIQLFYKVYNKLKQKQCQIYIKNLKMKKFQEILKEKAHINKIRNAKKTISANSKTNTSKMASSKVNDEAQLLLQLYENKNYDSIPAYKLLRTANLQQYTKGFIIRGYGINLGKLGYLTQQQKKQMYQDLKVLPGHTVKLDKIIKAIMKQSYQDAFQQSQLTQINSAVKSIRKDKTTYSSMSKKNGIQEDTEYQKQLQRVLNEYTPSMTQQKQKTEKTQKRSSLLSTVVDTKYYKTKYLPPKPLNKTQITHTNSDFKRKAIEPSTKSSIRKTASISSQKNIQKENKRKQQSAKQTLNRLLRNVTAGSIVESQKVMQMDLEINKIKDLYRSFDGAVMSSTVANLDIEQLVYAFAGHVAHKVLAAKQPLQKKPSDMYQLNLNNLKFQPKYQDSLDNQEPIQDEIGQILRQSYMHPLYRESTVMENIQCDEVNSEGENDEDQNQNTNPNEFMGKQEGSNMIQSSFLGGQSFHFGLQKPLQIFEQPQPTQIDYFKPTVDSIFNFIKNIVLSAKMERQIPIMAASYFDTFLEKSKIILSSLNYKRLLVTCLLLASKIWDDQSFQTPSFSKTFPEYSTILLNEMEKQILKFLEYKLKLDKRQYSLVYFKLRKFIKKNVKSYQNRKLNIKRILQLQNGFKTQYKTNFLGKRNSF